MKVYNHKDTREKRKNLRKSQTDAEQKLWLKLRSKQFYGKKFYRQYGIGQYIADFYCPSMKIVIEVDGGQHFSEEGMIYDKEREKFFDALGINTIRFNNLEVLNNIEGVLLKMEEELTPPSLLFEKEEEQ